MQKTLHIPIIKLTTNPLPKASPEKGGVDVSKTL